MRQRIDETVNPILPCTHQLTIFPAHRINSMCRHRRAEYAGHFIGKPPGAVYKQRVSISPAVLLIRTPSRGLQSFHFRMDHDIGAVVRCNATVGLNEIFTRDNSGRGNFNGPEPFHVGLVHANRGAIDDLHMFDAIGLTVFHQCHERFRLGG